MILSKILEEKRREVDRDQRILSFSSVKKKAESMYIRSSFKRNISRKGQNPLFSSIFLIAGLTTSTSISALLPLILFFDGNLGYLKMVKDRVSVPILRKDFIIDEYQVYQSAVAGADAILLIANILTTEELIRYYHTSKSLGMDVLVEVHNSEEMEKVLSTPASIIGINNRDLNDFEVDISVTQHLIRMIPENKIIVSESGIESYEQVMFLKSLGVNAVLIGGAFMKAENVGEKIRELMRDS